MAAYPEVFYENACVKNLKENTSDGVIFEVKLQILAKNKLLQVASSEFYKIFKNSFAL